MKMVIYKKWVGGMLAGPTVSLGPSRHAAVSVEDWKKKKIYSECMTFPTSSGVQDISCIDRWFQFQSSHLVTNSRSN